MKNSSMNRSSGGGLSGRAAVSAAGPKQQRDYGGGLAGRAAVSVAAPNEQRDYGGGLAGRPAMPVMSGNGLRATGDASAMVLRLEDEGPTHVRRELTAAVVTTHPFKCPAVTDGTTASVIAGGTVNGTTVTNSGGTALPAGTLVISDSGTQRVYLEVTVTKSVTAGGYVVGISTISSAKVKTAGSVPADTATVLCRQVARYVDGVKVTQDVTSSMEVAIRGTDAAGNFTVYWGQS